MSDSRHVRLAAFIRQNETEIVAEWAAFAKTLTPASTGMTQLALENHIKTILAFIADDLESPQSDVEQADKARGHKIAASAIGDEAGTHAAVRLDDSFTINQMVAEYRALRASVIKLWQRANDSSDMQDLTDLIRFNEAIDQSIMQSILYYTNTVEQSRNIFLGILGHDLRSPLGVIAICTETLLKTELDPRQTKNVQYIEKCAGRAARMINDLLDITRVQLNRDIPITCERLDLHDLVGELVQETRLLHPHRSINLAMTGDGAAWWDGSRIGQVLSNLINNAIAHGSPGTPVNVSVQGDESKVIIAVQNQGTPIPASRIGSIFHSFTHESDKPNTAHLGLGLHITKKIVEAHGGTIAILSDADSGTRMTVTIPREPPGHRRS